METSQLRRLKLNATNIKSTLITYNSNARKLRLQEKTLLRVQDSQKKTKEKENLIERTGRGAGSAFNSIKTKILSGPMSIFDKVKEFFGIMLFAILVNNLPRLLRGLSKFFGNNPWIIPAIKQTIKIIANGILSFIDISAKVSLGTISFVKKQRDNIANTVNFLYNDYIQTEKEITGLLNRFLSQPKPKPTQPLGSPQQFAQSSGYGRYPVPQTFTPTQKYLPYQPVSSQGFAPGARPAILPPSPPSPVQNFATGGTVQPAGSRITSSNINRKSKGKKARQSLNQFKYFSDVVSENKENVARDKKNNKKFADILKDLDIVQKLREKLKDEDGSTKGDGGGGGGGGIDPGDFTVQGGEDDFWLLSLISLYENANPQGAADVAQSIYNRMGYSGRSAREIILSPGQYQPVGQYGSASDWNKVVDKETAIAHIKKYPGNAASVKGLNLVAKSLVDPSKQSSAAKFVGNRPDFRSQDNEQSTDSMTDDTTRHNQTFGFNRGSSYKGKSNKPVSIPSFVQADVITEYTPTNLKGKNTAFQGSTGRSTGEHFHIGPSELLDPKTLEANRQGTSQGLVDARQAAFRLAKALIARKEKFIFSNSGVEIDPNKRITDQKLRNYILEEQNAHMSRSMGSSWGGVDIAVYKSGMDVPIPVGKVVYHDDGFGFRAKLLGTKGFVGHLAKGSKATPTTQIEKPKTPPPSVEPAVLTPEKRSQIINEIRQSKPGSGQRIRIPGVGTYVRGTEGFGLFSKPVDKFFDENGDPLPQKDFKSKMKGVLNEDNLISRVTPKKVENKNLDLDIENGGSSSIIIAQQQIIVPGETKMVPFPVQSKSSGSSGGGMNMEQLSARSLV